MQPVTQAGHVRRGFDLEPAYRHAIEGLLVGSLWFRRAQGTRTLGIGRPNIEMRALPEVARKESRAILQPTIDMHDGNATPLAVGNNAIARLQNETVRFNDNGHFAPISEGPRAQWQQFHCPVISSSTDLVKLKQQA